MEKSIEVGYKAMLKARADLYCEYHDGKASGWDVDRAIKKYEEAASEDESDDESFVASPSIRPNPLL